MTTAAQIVETVRGDKGQHEVPMGSNTGPFVQKAQAATWLSSTGWPWCAAEVCYVCQRAGVPLVGANSAGAHDLANRHQQNWVPDKTKWKPGMVVDYNIGSGHTGILTSINLARGTVTSCDGNWADAVTEHEMPISSIRAVWRIPGVIYEAAPAPKPPPKRIPPFVVTTSASGHRKVVFTTPNKRTLTNWLLTRNLARLFPTGITITRGKAQ